MNAKLTTKAKHKKMKAAKQAEKDLESIKNILVSFLHEAKLTFSSYSEADYQRDLDELVIRLEKEGIGFATRTLPCLSEGLLQYLETGHGKYPGFALSPSKYPFFLKRLFRLAYKKEPDVEAIRLIYQLSVSFKKLKGPYRDSELKSQLNDFISVDAQLPTEFTSEPDQLIIEHARAFITVLFQDLDEESFKDLIIPRPGPGATNTPRDHHLRFIPNQVFQQVDDIFPCYEWFYNSYNHMAWEIPHLKALYNCVKEEQTSRFTFVDKVVGKARGICIEENEVQYMQQGVKHMLYEWIEKHPLTKGKINFTDQSINAHLALEASLSGRLATLDMKEASDRISRNLVGELFRDVPFLRDALMCLSTRTITFPDKFGTLPLRTNKYAPMGSGLCFPVMSLVHYALIRSILYISMHSDMTLDNIYVYGDDIIVPSETAVAVFDWLPRFGMKFNVSKSFYRGKFRESCGIHAYNGVDITPVYFKYTTVNCKRPTVLQSLIANEYDLWNRGYWTVCDVIRRCTNVKMFVHPSSDVVGWKRPPILQYNHCGIKHRYNVSRHNVQYKVKVFRDPIPDTLSFDDNSGLTRRYVTKANAHTDLRRSKHSSYAYTWRSQWELVS